MNYKEKKILILYPHFPPSNLAGVHRARLFAQHLPSFGWEPVILTVDEKFYEEKLDYNLQKLLPAELRIEKVNAMPVTKPRFIGDVGLRAFFQLYTKAKKLIKSENFHFLYIPIPSFYVALLGRWLHSSTGIKYGIDYIDPWVHKFPGSEKILSRHWFSTLFAQILEPIAVKKASLITGVAEGYYKGVKERNRNLAKQAVFAAMPYGGEKADHDKLELLQLEPYLFKKAPGKIQLVYAGAMLPKAFEPLEAIFSGIQKQKNEFKNLQIHFIGTGKTANNISGFNIKPLAEKYNLWNDLIFEYPARIPYLDVLIHLKAADGVFILGSTEPHYTPSKVYQAVLSKKPIFAILHSKSTACTVINTSKAGILITFSGDAEIQGLSDNFLSGYMRYNDFSKEYNFENVNLTEFEKFSAYKVTEILATNLDKVTIDKYDPLS
jgi:hypothetical protein